jgi:hypothetical protein
MAKPLVGRWPYVGDLRGASFGPKRTLPRNVLKRRVATFATLVRLGAISRHTRLTVDSVYDGGGGQVLRTLQAQAFCKSFGVPYAHTPFHTMEHTSGAAEIGRWEERFDLGRGYVAAADLALPRIAIDQYLRSPHGWMRPYLIEVNKLGSFAQAHIEALDLVRDSARAAYRGPSRPPADFLRVAMHVRRGDVTAGKPKRFTDDATVMQHLLAVQAEVARRGARAEITLYSEGDEREFAAFADAGIGLRLNGDALAALDDMVNADILVTAKSAFSYVAAIYNRTGTIWYQPWRYPPLPGWIVLGAAGPGGDGAGE